MNKTIIRFLLLLLLFCRSNNELKAQTALPAVKDSSGLRISLLTCSPGDELYSLFGHSAVRIIDSSNLHNDYFDIVYNYGTFNFDDEGFYIKFVRGKLLYYISIMRFADFKYDYQVTNRGMTEQVLDLSSTEKKNIQHALNENLRKENMYYKYDFFFDNCTTRLRDLLVKNKAPHPVLPAVMPVNTRFRQAIHQYLDNGKQYWSELGIDILLGAPTDAVMTPAQQEFLPDNLMRSFDSCRNVPLVRSSGELYQVSKSNNQGSWFTPLFFFSMLLAFFVLLSLSKNKWIQTILVGLDGLLFFLTGLLGILLIFMWFGTDHSMTKNNYNLIWAWPTHLFFSFGIISQKKIVKKYFLLTSIGLTIVLCSWFFLPQQMNNALIPFVLLLIYRSVMRWLK